MWYRENLSGKRNSVFGACKRGRDNTGLREREKKALCVAKRRQTNVYAERVR